MSVLEPTHCPKWDLFGDSPACLHVLSWACILDRHPRCQGIPQATFRRLRGSICPVTVLQAVVLVPGGNTWPLRRQWWLHGRLYKGTSRRSWKMEVKPIT